jgi:hypothetical protein
MDVTPYCDRRTQSRIALQVRPRLRFRCLCPGICRVREACCKLLKDAVLAFGIARCTSHLRHAQVSFIEHVCLPFFSELSRFVPAIEADVAQMRQNLEQWDEVQPFFDHQ